MGGEPLDRSPEGASRLKTVLERLLIASARSRWTGWDPYDGLTSPWVRDRPFPRLLRQGWIQLHKRSPINLRPWLGIRPTENPKALALFVLALLPHVQDPASNHWQSTIADLLSRLRELQRPGFAGACWGYPFDWQSRAFFAPRGTPNLVVTAFAGLAFLEAFRWFHRDPDLAIARSACEFILKDLPRTWEGKTYCLGYIPRHHSVIYNANLLGASLLAQVGMATQEPHLAELASQAVQFVVNHQRPDGAWPYGAARNQRWVDHVHTGFNLVALLDCQEALQETRWRSSLVRGFQYYRTHLFSPAGLPKPRATAVFPIDIHDIAQAILTLTRFTWFDETCEPWAHRIALWALRHMSSETQGVFFYRRHRWYTNRIPYIRWAQAWMGVALSRLLYQRSRMTSHVPSLVA